MERKCQTSFVQVEPPEKLSFQIRKRVRSQRFERTLFVLLACFFQSVAAQQTIDNAPLVELGRTLFFDAKLSANQHISCASCHDPDKAFTDGRKVAIGIDGKSGTRNTPSIIGAGSQSSLFWDGRRNSLEEQVLDPFANPVEHGLKQVEDVVAIIDANETYRLQFARAFGNATPSVTTNNLRAALAAYVRSLTPTTSAFERHQFKNEGAALSATAKRGLDLFVGRAQCSSCHTIDKHAAALSDGKFHGAGIGIERIVDRLPELTKRLRARDGVALDHVILNDPDLAELGRFLVTGDPKDIAKFKTPSLRNVSRTAPYMHDGSVATLEETLERELYYRSLQSGKPIVLDREEKSALLEFLRTL